MTTTIAMLRATHLAPSLLVTAVSALLTVLVGRGPAGAAAVAAAVLAGQFSVGWSNDWIDRHRDFSGRRLDKPIVAGQVPPRLVAAAALAALAACAGLSLLSGSRAAVIHLLAVGLGWAYNLGLKSTVLSVVPYAGAFGLLPVFVTAGLPGAPLPPWWAVTGAALMGAGAHFVNALADLDDDAHVGVAGLPQRAGPTRSLLIAVALLGAGSGHVLVGPGPSRAALAGLLVIVAIVAGVVAAARTGHERTAWSLTLTIALVAVAALAASGAALA